jgi:hypothetical protein
VTAARNQAIEYLENQIKRETGQPPLFSPLSKDVYHIHVSGRVFGMSPFCIEKGWYQRMSLDL